MACLSRDNIEEAQETINALFYDRIFKCIVEQKRHHKSGDPARKQEEEKKQQD